MSAENVTGIYNLFSQVEIYFHKWFYLFSQVSCSDKELISQALEKCRKLYLGSYLGIQKTFFFSNCFQYKQNSSPKLRRKEYAPNYLVWLTPR